MQGNHKMAGADLLTSLCLMGFGAAVIINSNGMKVFRMLIVSPGLFPMILGWVFVVAGLVMFIVAVKNGGLRQAKRYLSADYFRAVLHSPKTKRGSVIFLSILAYVLLFGNDYFAMLNFYFTVGNTIIQVNVGFILVTAAYLFGTFVYLKAMTARNAAIVSLVSAILIFYAFNKGFGIPVP